MVRRRLNKEPNESISNGYTYVNDSSLYKTGIRGKNKVCLYCVVFILFVLAMLNAVVTAGLIYILGITHTGMATLEFIPGGKLVRCLVDMDMENFYLFSGLMGSRYNKHLEFNSYNDSDIEFHTSEGTGASVFITPDSTVLTADNFVIMDPDSGNVTLGIGRQTILNQQNTNNAFAKSIEVDSINSWLNLYPDLFIDSLDNRLMINGSGGIFINSTRLTGTDLSARKDITLKAENLTMESMKGTYFNLGQNDETQTQQPPPSSRNDVKTYKICICVPSGKLFAVPGQPGMGCANANEQKNPCE